MPRNTHTRVRTHMQLGWEVHSRNEKPLVWPFHFLNGSVRDPSNPTQPEVAVCPVGFYIAGYIDGLCQQVTRVTSAAADNLEAEWEMENVVVEIKNRVRRLHDVPPFYDQIQCALYMLMLGASKCDLVEAVRERSHSTMTVGSATGATAAAATVASVTASHQATKEALAQPSKQAPMPRQAHKVTTSIRIHKVNLGGSLHHGEQWTSTIHPRLCSIASAIITLRSNENLRYQWLTALSCFECDPSACWAIMVRLAPFLQQCIPTSLKEVARKRKHQES